MRSAFQGLAMLIDLDRPALNLHFPEPNTIAYTMSGTEADINEFRQEVKFSRNILMDGIAAITDILKTVDIHCPDEVDNESRIDALAMVYQLMGVLPKLDEAEWILNRTTAEKTETQ